jgi:hypothetical protein
MLGLREALGLTDGDILGDTEGLILGDIEGETLGLMDGEILGLIDGEILGDALGLFDGLRLADGLTEGEILGDLDGEIDGLRLSDSRTIWVSLTYMQISLFAVRSESVGVAVHVPAEPSLHVLTLWEAEAEL